MSWDLYIEGPACPHCGAESQLAGFNYTHNTNAMMRAAGVGPEHFKGKTCAESIPDLERTIAELERNPAYWRATNPENGWGSYDGLLPVLKEILTAMKAHPEFTITVSM